MNIEDQQMKEYQIFVVLMGGEKSQKTNRVSDKSTSDKISRNGGSG